MAIVRAFVTMLALAALVGLPCVIALYIVVEEQIEDVLRAVRRAVRRRRVRRAQRRAVSDAGKLVVGAAGLIEPAGPPIEQIAADLRRIGRLRLGVATRSPVWYAAVERAYDDRLRLACRALSIDEHLSALEGVDRDIERVRVEGELIGAGLMLNAADVDGRQGRR